MSTMNATNTPATAVTLTESAAEQIKHLLAQETDAEGKGLRLFIERGGCSGMEYGMQFDHPKDGDCVAEHLGVTLIVDPESEQYLKESIVDFKDELNDSGFKVVNPNARQSCGCGKSFEV